MDDNNEKRTLPPGWGDQNSKTPEWITQRESIKPKPIIDEQREHKEEVTVNQEIVETESVIDLKEGESKPEPEVEVPQELVLEKDQYEDPIAEQIQDKELPVETAVESIPEDEDVEVPLTESVQEEKLPEAQTTEPTDENEKPQVINSGTKNEKVTATKVPSKNRKGVVIALVILVALAAAGAGSYFLTDGFNFGGHVTQKVTELEAGNTYSAEDLFDVEDGYSIKGATEVYEFFVGETDSSGEVKMLLAEELKPTIEVTSVSESGKEKSEEFTFLIVDTTAPEILVGDNYVLQLGSTLDYDELLLFSDTSIKDLSTPLTKEAFESSIGGKVTVDDSALNSDVEGEYPVMVTAEDAFGNKAEKSFTVTVSDSGSAITLDADAQYEANIFLSNFAEQNITSINIETSSAREFAKFAIEHVSMNGGYGGLSYHDVSYGSDGSYVTLACMSVDSFESAMKRFFGIEISRDALNNLPSPRFTADSELPVGPFFDGSYLYDYAATGYGIMPIAIADSVLSFADGHQEIKFSVYNCFWSGRDLYQLTPEQAAADSRLELAGHGTAVVTPKDLDGRKTYELISYECSY